MLIFYHSIFVFIIIIIIINNNDNNNNNYDYYYYYYYKGDTRSYLHFAFVLLVKFVILAKPLPGIAGKKEWKIKTMS